MRKTLDNPWRKAGSFTALAIFAALATLAIACTRKPFLYKPNAPLWPGHSAQAPLFAVASAIQLPHDLTPYEAAYSTPTAPGQVLSVTQAPAGSWPAFSPAVLGRALATELAQDGFVSSASALDDPEHDDEFAAAGQGAMLFITGKILRDEVDNPSDNGGTLELSLEINVMARGENDGEFTWQILDKTYQAQARIGQDGDANEAANQALNRLFAQAAQDAAKVLQDPELQAKLGWAVPPAP